MKLKIAGLLSILFLALTPSVRAQSLTVNNVNLSLGESEAKARADILAAGMDIKPMTDTSYMLTVKQGNTFDLLGDVAFTGGKVTWVQRDWFLNQTPNDRGTLVNIFFSAATSLLEGNEKASCTVSVKSQDNSPSSGVLKNTTIQCMKANYTHSLTMDGVDCSSGCSIGSIGASFSESIKRTD